jgi:hypothetical protein
MIVLLPFAARGAAVPFAQVTLSLSVVMQALFGWVFISCVAWGIARRWRLTRAIIAFTFLYFLALAFYSFWYGGFTWPRLIVRLACYGIVACLAYALAPPLRRASSVSASRND